MVAMGPFLSIVLPFHLKGATIPSETEAYFFFFRLDAAHRFF